MSRSLEWALSHTAWLAAEQRHTTLQDAQVTACVDAGLAVWLPGQMAGWRRVALTKEGGEKLANQPRRREE